MEQTIKLINLSFKRDLKDKEYSELITLLEPLCNGISKRFRQMFKRDDIDEDVKNLVREGIFLNIKKKTLLGSGTHLKLLRFLCTQHVLQYRSGLTYESKHQFATKRKVNALYEKFLKDNNRKPTLQELSKLSDCSIQIVKWALEQGETMQVEFDDFKDKDLNDSLIPIKKKERLMILEKLSLILDKDQQEVLFYKISDLNDKEIADRMGLKIRDYLNIKQLVFKRLKEKVNSWGSL